MHTPLAIRPVLCCLVGAVLVAGWEPGSAAQEPRIDFNEQIRPILSNRCFACHGPDEDHLEAGLRLDDRRSATGELDSGAVAISPGNPDASELLRRVAAEDESVRMPPPEFGAALTPAEIALLRRWVQQGAEYAVHWAYAAPSRPVPPPLPPDYADWGRNAIDQFALRTMLAHGQKPSPEADRHALVRRVFLDLTGLPPTVEEADAFLRDTQPDAYERLVEDLLQRPSFGEHWARKWLDLARYADSAGYADDPPRTIWAYRDWVIRALNDNLPFDQFTIQQIAGDLLPDPSEDQLLATAFHRNTLTNNEGGTQDEEFRNVAVVDRVNTTMAVWMGTTMACAQCHNHKYDPISQEEYFRFFAILNNTQDADRRDEAPVLEIYTPQQRREQERLRARIADLRRTLRTPTDALAAEQRAWERQLQGPTAWTLAAPRAVTRESGAAAEILAEGEITIPTAAEKDAYRIDLAPPEGTVTVAGIRLETLPAENLPGGGAGHGGGNFVITRVRSQQVPADPSSPRARYVRITNPGQRRILSLAEVEVVSGGRNVARQGTASQHSTAFNGPPELAIDGDTNGDHQQGSVTHTETVDDPWWELDLGAESPIESLTIWNRTDNGLQSRLKDFSVELLSEQREPVWQRQVADPPDPAVQLAPSNIREIEFRSATADYHQPGFEPSDVLRGASGAQDGWAVGGATAQPHALVLAPSSPLPWNPGDTLRVFIEQQSPHANHLLGKFRILITPDPTAIRRSELPADVLALLDREESARTAAEQERLSGYFREQAAESLREQRLELAAAEKQLAEMKPATTAPILRELSDRTRETHLQYRGNYLDKGPLVEPGLPAVFHGPSVAEAAVDRLALARWLVDQKNPLTARVLANRYWETLFGRGIVATSEEFGSQGELPTHPQLLDWLAVEFMESGWDVKALLRMIVTSAVYRQSSRIVGDAADADPDNRWLARGPRVRLSAEMVRDQALAVSGLLSDKMFGPPVKPPQPSLGLTAAFGGSTDWTPSTGGDRYRRAVYTTWRRSNPYPSMAAFDAPNREVCTVRRSRTNTPLQSLVTLNDPVYVEAAQALARRALTRPGELRDQIQYAFRCCLARPASDAELAALEQLFSDARDELANDEAAARQLAADPLGDLPADMDVVAAAAMTVVGNVLLNLDEMFLKR